MITQDDIVQLTTDAKDVFFIYVKHGLSTAKNEIELKLEEKIAELNRPNIQVHVERVDSTTFSPLEPATNKIYAFIPGNTKVMMSGVPEFFLLDNPEGGPGNFTRAMWHLDAQKNNLTLIEYLDINHPEEAQKVREQSEKFRLLHMTTSEVFPPTFEESRKRLLDQYREKSLQEIQTTIASQEKAEARFSVCSGCELFNAASSLCNECGCEMTTKVNLISASCPLSKWDS